MAAALGDQADSKNPSLFNVKPSSSGLPQLSRHLFLVPAVPGGRITRRKRFFGSFIDRIIHRCWHWRGSDRLRSFVRLVRSGGVFVRLFSHVFPSISFDGSPCKPVRCQTGSVCPIRSAAKRATRRRGPSRCEENPECAKHAQRLDDASEASSRLGPQRNTTGFFQGARFPLDWPETLRRLPLAGETQQAVKFPEIRHIRGGFPSARKVRGHGAPFVPKLQVRAVGCTLHPSQTGCGLYLQPAQTLICNPGRAV